MAGGEWWKRYQTDEEATSERNKVWLAQKQQRDQGVRQYNNEIRAKQDNHVKDRKRSTGREHRGFSVISHELNAVICSHRRCPEVIIFVKSTNAYAWAEAEAAIAWVESCPENVILRKISVASDGQARIDWHFIENPRRQSRTTFRPENPEWPQATFLASLRENWGFRVEPESIANDLAKPQPNKIAEYYPENIDAHSVKE